MDLEESDFNLIQEKNTISLGFLTITGELIWSNKYPVNKYLKDIVSDFTSNVDEKKLSKYFQIGNNFNKYNLSFYDKNMKKLKIKNNCISLGIEDLEETVSRLFNLEYNNSSITMASSNKDLKIFVRYEKKFKNLVENFEQFILNKIYLIGKPKLSSNKYYLYHRHLKELRIIKCPKVEINLTHINNFSLLDNYCNTLNYLYIYEGILNNDIQYSKFYSINLIKNEISLISEKFPKRVLHSMIFIPENYIFIIGGKQTKEVLTYEIKENNTEYDEYPHLLPKELYEPSLISINNQYIYVLENSTIHLNIFRINLTTISPFESIKVNRDKNIEITQKFFGVVKNKNSILFLGGQMLNNNNKKNMDKCFEFNYDTNTISISKREFIPFNFIEKTFIPFGDDIYIQFTECKNDNKNDLKMIQFNGREQEFP